MTSSKHENESFVEETVDAFFDTNSDESLKYTIYIHEGELEDATQRIKRELALTSHQCAVEVHPEKSTITISSHGDGEALIRAVKSAGYSVEGTEPA